MVKIVVKYAWLIQFDIFVILFLFIPRGSWRLPFLLAYIPASAAVVIAIRRRFRGDRPAEIA